MQTFEISKKKAKTGKPLKEKAQKNKLQASKLSKDDKENNKDDTAEVPAKKRKLSTDEGQKDVQQIKKKDRINKGILPIFDKLLNKQEYNREKLVKDVIALLNNEEDQAKRTATCSYAIKRLVRCTGANNKEAVAFSAGCIQAILDQVSGMLPIDVLNLVKAELPVGPQSKSMDDSLAAVGQIVTALAVIGSQYMKDPSVELMETIYPLMVVHLKGREYLISLCAEILAETFRFVKLESFEAYIWPTLKAVLSKPLAELKLQSCNLLLAVHLHYPKVLTLKQLEKIFWQKKPTYEELFDLYLNNTTIQSTNIYEYLGHFLANAQGDGKLVTAWQEHLMKQMPLKRNSAKASFIQTLSWLLIHYKGEVEPVQKLFAEKPLVQLLLQELGAARQLNARQHKMQQTELEKIKSSQLELIEICQNFESSLLVSFTGHLDESLKVSILKALLEQQPQVEVIVQTPHLVRLLINTLQENSRRDIYKLYSTFLTHTNVEGEQQVTKADREHCLTQMQYMLQSYPHLMKSGKSIEFLVNVSLFHLNAQKKPCPVNEAPEFSKQTASRCEEILLSCLVHNIGSSQEQLAALIELLRRTMTPLIEKLDEPEIQSKLRSKQTPELREAWQQVVKVLQAPAKPDAQQLALLFDALILFLGLASLAPSCSISVDLINDLLICKQNALNLGKKSGKKSQCNPDLKWQDVLTDALIQLMLQTGGFWREFVKTVSIALMPHLALDNLGQMLDMLDMSNNPLDKKQAGEEDEDEEEEEDEDEDEKESEESEEEDNEEESEEEDEDEETNDEESDNEEEGDNDDGEATRLEMIRENVRLALINGDNDDNDASSVDWNDVDEAEGERLNKALENALQAFKPKGGKGGGSKSKPKQQTKSERIDSTALLHFRIRMLDLVELFAQAQPNIEVMSSVIHIIYRICRAASLDKNMKPLADASKKKLRSLLSQPIINGSVPKPETIILEAIEQFIAEETDAPDESEEQPKQKKKQQQQQQQPKVSGDVAELHNKCVGYLISQFNAPNMTESKVWPVVETYLKTWVSRRNSPYTLGSFDELFKSNWIGSPYLAISFVKHLVAKETRQFRRKQILELLNRHSSRIRSILPTNDAAATELSAYLKKYEPAGPTDRKLHSKLLTNVFPTPK